MKYYIVLILTIPLLLTANSLEVCSECEYKSLTQAANVATPGDTIFLNGTFTKGDHIQELKGNPEKWIHIIGKNDATYDGNTTGIQFSDCEYLYISNITIQGQSLNGMNIDDAGTYDTPTHHITIDNCTFRDMAGQGNNDLLKLSGLDYFEIRNCTFENGSPGGSGLDMVGCHLGLINNNYFENMGFNCIQAKGGTHYVNIARNMFINGGLRAINIGGSTGLQFFRPQDANFESQSIHVNSNIFVGGECAVAYVGTIASRVYHNTIIGSRKWVFRILQETVDTSRFLPCSGNHFNYNVVMMDDSLNRTVNIGPNTEPGTFSFGDNYWYNEDNPEWNHNLPSQDFMPIIGVKVDLQSRYGYDIYPDKNSVLVGAGSNDPRFTLDFDSIPFRHDYPTIGAFELQEGTSTSIRSNSKNILVQNGIIDLAENNYQTYKLYNYSGVLLSEGAINYNQIDISAIEEKYIIAILESKRKKETVFVINQ